MYLCPEPKKLELKGGYYRFEVGTEPKVKTTITPLLSQKESYRLMIDDKGVCIEAADEAGVYYANITLKQLLMNYRGCLPWLYIYDEPEFYYRGFMIDSCRHFFTVDEIKKMINAASLFKFNKFHFHLSDDQGFRVEIESYPNLTTVGSVRPSSNFGRGENDETPYAHYYTKQELKEIVEYCKERYIEVIPEFDIPGHTTAVIASYPELSCAGEKVEPKTTAGVFTDILCGGNPETLKMIYSVIDEMCDIFPSKYFHIGGDEAPKNRWNVCPKCQAKVKELNLKNTEELHGWLVNEISLHLKKKGKKTICWNEAVRAGNIEHDNVTVAWWLDRTTASLDWANAGNPVIVESFTPYYVDYPYGMHSLKSVYLYNPRKIRGMTPLGASSVVGIESPIWTEYIRDFESLTKMCFPRWLAVADTAWNGNDNKDFAKFLKNTVFFCEILREYGITAASEKEWNILPHSRASQTLSFFKNKLSKDFVKHLLKKDEN